MSLLSPNDVRIPEAKFDVLLSKVLFDGGLTTECIVMNIIEDMTMDHFIEVTSKTRIVGIGFLFPSLIYCFTPNHDPVYSKGLDLEYIVVFYERAIHCILLCDRRCPVGGCAYLMYCESTFH
jgi:hypothetical protein